MLIALVGAPNKGKSSLFNALTAGSAQVADYPFTTIDPNKGVAYASAPCPCKRLGVTCSPRNSRCENGVRKVPVNLIDVAGLVPGAHEGKGMGNQFLNDIAAADALVCVADASGKTDESGMPARERYSPADDVQMVEKELAWWLAKLIERQCQKAKGKTIADIARVLTGVNVSEEALREAIKSAGVNSSPASWREPDFVALGKALLAASKPMVVAANKVDLPGSLERIAKMREALPGREIIPTSADSEIALARAETKGLIAYDGSSVQRTLDAYPPQIDAALGKLEAFMQSHGSTGCRELVNAVVFDFLHLIVAYPVEDEGKYADHSGRVLPDAVLLPHGSTAVDLAGRVHTHLAEGFLYAVDAVGKKKISRQEPLENGAVIKIVSAK